jgi:hypothetical protein
MIAAMLIAAALMSPQVQYPPDTIPSIPGTSGPNNPNYATWSAHVASVNNPVYSFPSDVNDTTSINGRIYKGVQIIGGEDNGAKSDMAHAAASYGAAGEEANRVQAEVQGLFRFHPTSTVEFSPWSPVATQLNSPASDAFSRAQQKMANRAEEARQQWLKDNNYVGGVRTFVNEVGQPKKQGQLPEPRGVLQINPEVPAFKSHMHVMTAPGTHGFKLAGDLIKVVRPVETPKAEAVASKPEEKPAATVAQK